MNRAERRHPQKNPARWPNGNLLHGVVVVGNDHQNWELGHHTGGAIITETDGQAHVEIYVTEKPRAEFYDTSATPTELRLCEGCGLPLEGKRRDAKTHNSTCRSRKRRRLLRVPEPTKRSWLARLIHRR